MSHIRRWARAYYNLSPIFQDNLFQKPGNEGLVVINPRLFSAYLIKMTKLKVYNIEKIVELVKNYYNKPNYWTSYTLKLLAASQQTANKQKDNTRQRFQALISKFYYQNISQNQFQEFCRCFQELLPTKKISQLDFYVMDLSFSSIQQIIQVSSINQQSALEAIGHTSSQLLEKQLKHNINHNVFQLIFLLNKLKQSGNLTPELANLHSLYEGNKKNHELFQSTKKQLGICIRKQALGFMLWLLHVNQLGYFVFKFIKQDYLFSRYCENSVQITCNILEVIEVSSSQKFSQLILLNEIVHKLQNMQEQKKFFEHVKRNIQIQIRLKNLKEKLHQILHRFEQTGIQAYKWIEQIDKFQIDFKSSHSVTIISNLIKKLIQNQYFSIILSDNQYEKLLSLCIKIDDKALYSKTLSKIDKKKLLGINPKNCLLYFLQKTRSERTNNKSPKVYSIYELKRIRNSCQKNGEKIKQIIKNMRSQDQEVVLLFLECLKSHSKDESSEQLKQKMEKIFEEFKL